MMRMTTAGLALLIAAPAAAQTGQLPVWMVGDWYMAREQIKICYVTEGAPPEVQ